MENFWRLRLWSISSRVRYSNNIIFFHGILSPVPGQGRFEVLSPRKGKVHIRVYVCAVPCASLESAHKAVCVNKHQLKENYRYAHSRDGETRGLKASTHSFLHNIPCPSLQLERQCIVIWDFLVGIINPNINPQVCDSAPKLLVGCKQRIGAIWEPLVVGP